MSAQLAVTEAVVQQAAEWMVRLSGDNTRASELAEFRKWQQIDPMHAAVVSRMSALIAATEALRDDAGETRAAYAAIRAGVTSRQSGRKRKLAVVAMCFTCVFAAALISLQVYSPYYLLADMRTGTGEWQSRVLADNSYITLNSNSAVDIRFGRRERHLKLIQGEVLVNVARDAARPFIVETEHGTIRALGTRFVVSREDGQTRLLMLESKTAVQSESQRHSDKAVVVDAGQGVRITATSITPLESIDTRSVADAWRSHQLVVQDRPLSEVLEALARYRRGKIFYTASNTDLRVSAVLPLDDTDKALLLLESSLPIRVSTVTPWLVRVQDLSITQ